MPITLTPAHIAAVHKGFTRNGKAPPAGYSPEQIQFARQRGYPIPINYKPGPGLINSQIKNNVSTNNYRNSLKIYATSGINRGQMARKRKQRKTRKNRK